MNSQKCFKYIKWSVYGSIALTTSLIIALGLIAPESVKALSDFNINQSATFVLIRLGMYTALYVNWKRIVISFNPDVPEYRIAKSRKSVLTIIVIYEVFIGFNILKLLGV